MKKIREKICGKVYIILPVITFLCFAGFIGSLVFPDTVLDTYEVNMKEDEGDEEVALSLQGENHITYEMNTNGLAMRGIQVGINKQGKDLKGILHYDVYLLKDNSKNLVSSNVYSLEEGFDLQYVYLPYNEYEKCVGNIMIDFYTEGNTEEAQSPAIMANHKMTENTKTSCTIDSEFAGSLKGSYIYTHKTYPFLYDFRIMTCIFLAVSMTVQYPRLKGKAKKKHEK